MLSGILFFGLAAGFYMGWQFRIALSRVSRPSEELIPLYPVKVQVRRLTRAQIVASRLHLVKAGQLTQEEIGVRLAHLVGK